MVESILKHRFYALKSFLMGVLVLAGVLIPFFYSQAYTSSFENDTEKEDWYFAGAGIKEFSTEDARTGSWSMKFRDSAGVGTYFDRELQPRTNGFLNFYIKRSSGEGNQNLQVEIADGKYGDPYTNLDYARIEGLPIDNVWHKITYEWNDERQARLCLDGDCPAWHDWYISAPPYEITFLRVISFYGGADLNVYFLDDFEFFEYFYILGFDPIITAEKPIECEWNKNEDWIFGLKGKIEIPTENPNAYTKFLLRLYVRQPMEMGLNFIDITFTEFPNLKAGESWSWDFPDFEIPAEENGYSLTYWLEGYNLETLKPFRWDLMPIDICGKETILSNKSEFPVGLIPTEWLEMIYEDCSALTGFEKIMCEFTNWVKSIFAPSKEQLNALNQDLDQIKTKFPFTYISIFFNFVKNVKKGINENQGISFKILGVEGNVDFSFWEKTTSYGGVIQSFSTFFRGFIILIVLVGFVGGWLIPFISKIL